jgi:hypothetical protein
LGSLSRWSGLVPQSRWWHVISLILLFRESELIYIWFRYIIVENLRYFLSGFNTSKPMWFGHKFKAHVKNGYFSGGAGNKSIIHFSLFVVVWNYCVK